MNELAIFLAVVGLVTSSIRQRLIYLNPFQIYFGIWLGVYVGYYFNTLGLRGISNECWAMLISINLIWFVVGVLTNYLVTNRGVHESAGPNAMSVTANTTLMRGAIFLCLVTVFPFYTKAVELSGYLGVFDVAGYISLRAALTEDSRAYGVIQYVPVVSMVCTSIAIPLWFNGKIGLSWVVVSTLSSLIFCYLSTGRTFFLVFIVMVIAPLVQMGLVRLRGVIFFIALFLVAFAFVGFMTAKGFGAEQSPIESFLLAFESYFLTPLAAFGYIFDNYQEMRYGENTFRFLVSIAKAIGVQEATPVPIIRDSVFIPIEANVFTVYDPYFRDLSWLGVYVSSVLMLGFHVILYVKKMRGGVISVYVYSLSLYFLIMQFYQDSYLTLVSQWLQTFFWYFVFLKVFNPKG